MIKRLFHKLRTQMRVVCAFVLSFPLLAEQAFAFGATAPTTGFGYYFFDQIKNGIFDGPIGWSAGLGLLGAAVFFALKGPKSLSPIALVGAGAIPNASAILTSVGLLF